MIYLYNLLLLLGTVFAVPYLLLRLITGKDSFSAMKEKLGLYNIAKPRKGGIWIHAVSVGETNTAIPVVDSLLSKKPGQTIIFSTSTATGMALAKERLKGKAVIVYFPLDFRFAVHAALDFFEPALFVFMETEIWPNFLHRAHSLGIRSVLINGRISDRSFGRYISVKPLIAPFLRLIGKILMQSEEDSQKIVSMGALKETVSVTGNIKFDKPIPQEESKRDSRNFFGIPQENLVVIFASIHPGEDELVIGAIKELRDSHKDFFAIIAPRHVERAKAIASLCKRETFLAKLRTEKGESPKDILILDTIGELARIYGAVNVAVIGGSFVKHGGQNPLEASLWKIPVVFGPHMENFKDISHKLIDGGGAIMVEDRSKLVSKVSYLLKNPAERGKIGRAGYETVIKNRGALEKTVNAIENLLYRSPVK